MWQACKVLPGLSLSLTLFSIKQATCLPTNSPSTLSQNGTDIENLLHTGNIPDTFGLNIRERDEGRVQGGLFWNPMLKTISRIAKSDHPHLEGGVRYTFAGVEFRIDNLRPRQEEYLKLEEAIWTLQLLAQARFRNEQNKAYFGHLIDKSDRDHPVPIADFYFGEREDEVIQSRLSNTTLISEELSATNKTIADDERSWIWRDIPLERYNSKAACYALVNLYAAILDAEEPFVATWRYTHQETRFIWSYEPANPRQSTMSWEQIDMIDAVDHFVHYWEPVNPASFRPFDPRRMPEIIKTIADLRDTAQHFAATLSFTRAGADEVEGNSTSLASPQQIWSKE